MKRIWTCVRCREWGRSSFTQHDATGVEFLKRWIYYFAPVPCFHKFSPVLQNSPVRNYFKMNRSKIYKYLLYHSSSLYKSYLITHYSLICNLNIFFYHSGGKKHQKKINNNRTHVIENSYYFFHGEIMCFNEETLNKLLA